MDNVVKTVVDNEICSSCGVCAGFCPFNALSMKIQGNGDLTPSVNATRCKDNCHLCLEICPFSKGLHSPRERNTELFSHVSDAKYNKDIGWYTDTYVGYRVDETLRRASASGGLATWCLEGLLKEGLATCVAVIRIAKNREKGFFEFFAASSVDELRQSAGSIYHPVEISEIIGEMVSDRDKRWAIVGVPCLCAAIRNIPRLRHTVPFVFGLACGMYQNTFYTEILLAESGTDRENIRNIEYRRKSDGGQPFDYRFCGTDNRGTGKEVAYLGLPFYLGKHAYFRLNACNFCMDVFAETADTCFMDAWLPAYSGDPRGTSLVVIRNKEINKLFQHGLNKGEICIENISTEQVMASQSGHVRRKRELIYMRLGMCDPNGAGRVGPTAVEKVTWLLQRRAQKRSKKAWAKYGRRYGRFAFWLAVTDLLFMQSIASAAFKVFRLPDRLIGKCKYILAQLNSKVQE